MNTFDLAVIFAALAGIAMVIGGMVLIYKGALVLAGTDSSSALSIEWKQDFRLNTQAPGIAFFIIGLTFSAISIYASKPTEVEPIKIEGVVGIKSGPVTIRARSSTWTLESGSDGVVKGRIHPHVEDITLEITAPGYEPQSITFTLNELEDRTVRFDTVKLNQKIKEMSGSQINLIHPTEPLLPIDAQPSFGSAE